MKTNFQQRSKSGRTRGYWYVVVFGVAILCLWNATFFGTISSAITSPIYSFRTWFLHSESTVPVYFRSRSALSNELQNLKDALAQTRMYEDRVHALEEENALLRAIPQKEKKERIVADVLMRPGETPYDTLVVHKGSSDGVVDGALVYSDATVIGFVSRTFVASALVTLFSSPGIKSPVYMYGPNIFAHGEGMGGGMLRIAVPQGITLKEGEPVVVPLEGSGIYGHIEHIQHDVSQPDQYAYVAMQPSLNTLRFVAIDPFPMPHVSYADALVMVKGLSESPLLSPLRTLLQEIPVASSTASSTRQ